MNITKYYLSKGCPNFCIGCLNYTLKGENTCKDAECIEKVDKSLLEADLIVMTSPAYVFHATGAMKALLDHFAYRGMPHRVLLLKCLESVQSSYSGSVKVSGAAYWSYGLSVERVQTALNKMEG